MKPEIGDTLTPLRIDSVSPESMKAWAKFLHDPNPIHLDVEVVKAKGLGDKRINQGPANVGYIMNMLMADFPGGMIESMESRFVDNVLEGDAVEASGKITDVEDAGDSWRVTCEAGLKAEGRDYVITGTAVVKVPKSRA